MKKFFVCAVLVGGILSIGWTRSRTVSVDCPECVVAVPVVESVAVATGDGAPVVSETPPVVVGGGSTGNYVYYGTGYSVGYGSAGSYGLGFGFVRRGGVRVTHTLSYRAPVRSFLARRVGGCW